MLLSEVFEQLTHGELAQLHIGGAENAGITRESYSAMVSHINLGLTNLYTRFLLKEGTLFIKRQTGKSTYVLHSKYQEGNRRSPEAVRYIQEGTDFQDDILKVERVYDEQGNELGLNNEGDDETLTTPSYNMLVVPTEAKVDVMKVVYRANHPRLNNEDSDIDPSEVELELPYSHLEALLLFIASRVMNPVGMSSEFHDGNNYAAKYEHACQLLERQNLRVDKTSHNDRFHSKGWV